MKKRGREDMIHLVPIDKVDHSKIDPKCLPAIVVEVTPRSQYRLACKVGILDRVLCHGDYVVRPTRCLSKLENNGKG
jgi:hypothetical protein